jgi:N-acetylglutamate synthase-like GNAT family acetyltransferase
MRIVARAHPVRVVRRRRVAPVRGRAPQPILRAATKDDARAIHALIADHVSEGHLLPRTLEDIEATAERFVVACYPSAVARGANRDSSAEARSANRDSSAEARGANRDSSAEARGANRDSSAEARGANRDSSAEARGANRDSSAEARGAKADQVVACADLAPLSPSVAEVRSLVVDATARSNGLGQRLVGELARRAARDGFDSLCAFTHAAGYFVRMGFSIVPHTWVPEKIETDCRTCPQFRRCGQYAATFPLAQPAQSGVPFVPLAALHG